MTQAFPVETSVAALRLLHSATALRPQTDRPSILAAMQHPT